MVFLPGIFLSITLALAASLRLRTEKIEIIGARNLFVDLHSDEDYVDPGALCIDGNLTYFAKGTGTVSLQSLGKYTVNYVCRSGKKSYRTIIVGPAVCYMLWDPVCCGGQTYSNDCEANADACFIHEMGECRKNIQCKMIQCEPTFTLIGHDKKGCGGECVKKLDFEIRKNISDINEDGISFVGPTVFIILGVSLVIAISLLVNLIRM